MITSNVGSALHFLGEERKAAEYYEKALEEFSAIRVGWVSWAMQGHLPAKRKEYIQARLAQVAAGERPDPSLYLDGFGKTRQFTQVRAGRAVRHAQRRRCATRRRCAARHRVSLSRD